MKNLKLKSMVLFLCMLLLFAGCSKKEEEIEEETSEPSETTTVAETSASETTGTPSNPMFTTSAEDLVNSSSYDEIYSQCQDAGLTIMPFEDNYGISDVSFTEGFVAMDLGSGIDFDLELDPSDYDDLISELPDEYEDLLSDPNAFYDFLNDPDSYGGVFFTDELPGGYEDIFGDINLDDYDFEGLDDLDLSNFDVDNAPSLYTYDGDLGGYDMPAISTVICLRFESYEDAVDFVTDEYGTVTIEETDSGCVFYGELRENAVPASIEGAISSDGLLYMVVTTGD